MCIPSVHTLLKVVGYYDLSVLSMSVMVSKKSLDGFELYPIFCGFMEFFLLCKAPKWTNINIHRTSVEYS